jgi:Homeodomain-like domain
MANLCEKTNKKCHETEKGAIDFEILNRERHQSVKQYPYLCPDCNFYHLSSMPTGETTRARVDLEDASKYVVRTRRNAEEQERLRDEVLELTRIGWSAQRIADKLKISSVTVYNLRNSRTVEGIETKKLSIQEQIAKLQAELEAQERRKQELIEAQLLQARWSTAANSSEPLVVITQRENRWALPIEDATRLHKLLSKLLTEKAAA